MSLPPDQERAGVLRLRGDPGTAACVMTALGEGLVLQVLADPERDLGPALLEAGTMIRLLLGLPLAAAGDATPPSFEGVLAQPARASVTPTTP